MYFRSAHNVLLNIRARVRRCAAPVSESALVLRRGGQRGVTLLDTVVGVSLMLVVFLGIAGAFILSVDVVTNNKARSTALALANERMEYIRSLSYQSIGTSGGIPAGTIPQSETLSVNGTTFTRRTYIEYGDDPKDGLGAADTNHIPQDYKAAKVDVSWVVRNSTRHIVLASRFESPNGMEITCSPCGTLNINVVNAASAPLSGATVTVVNASTSPAVNLTTFTDASGVASLIGAPVASKYVVTVTKTGYSTAKTYDITSQNTNPNPGHLTVVNAQTTSGSFAIDVLGQKTIYTRTQILPGTWSDTFIDASKIGSSASTTVSAGVVHLEGESESYSPEGTLQSVAIEPTSLASWRSFSAATNTPAQTGIVFRFYDANGTDLIPDTQLPGNSAGFATSTVDLSGISTSTYPAIRVASSLWTANPANTPSVNAYTVSYDYGPLPLPNIPFTLVLLKPIGSGTSGTVYKYTQSFDTGASAVSVIPGLEWGTYSLVVPSLSGYDIASVCHPATEYSPGDLVARFSLAPGAQTVSTIQLAAHTTNSLLVDVRSSATGALIPHALVNLRRSGYNATITTDGCGQALFPGLAAASDYQMNVSASGYTTYGASGIVVSGAGSAHVTL